MITMWVQQNTSIHRTRIIKFQKNNSSAFILTDFFDEW